VRYNFVMRNEMYTGLVTKAISGFFTVVPDAGQAVTTAVTCQLPGRLKQEWQNTTLVAVGDRVTFSLVDEETGLIESVAPRVRALSRTRPSAGSRSLDSDREQVLVANPDQVIFVFSIKKPAPNLRKLDRFLVVAEKNSLPAIICVNKMDLSSPEKAQALFGLYEEIGYPVIYASAKTGQGVDEIRACLHNKITVLAGSSGVGKSSLLNAIQPGLGLKVSEVSKATEKGMHTTRYAELIPLDGGGYVADTPGIRGLALYDLDPLEVDAYFREIAPLVADCRFSDCTHRHEPGCAVRTAVSQGKVSRQRYDSYLRLFEEHEVLDDKLY
jgi:ribosome biogenesis GTPase